MISPGGAIERTVSAAQRIALDALHLQWRGRFPLCRPVRPVAFPSVIYIQCRRKIEMSPGVQSRDDTRLAADMTGATGHHSQTPDGILAVRLSDAFDCLAGSGLSYYCR